MKMRMFKFTVGKDYPYKTITDSRPPATMLMGFGREVVGQHFMTLLQPASETEEQVCSFVLTGATDKGYIFTCVYNDFKEV